jgi:hypothetical protein
MKLLPKGSNANQRHVMKMSLSQKMLEKVNKATELLLAAK